MTRYRIAITEPCQIGPVTTTGKTFAADKLEQKAYKALTDTVIELLADRAIDGFLATREYTSPSGVKLAIETV